MPGAVVRLLEGAGFAALALTGHLLVLGGVGPDLGAPVAGAGADAPAVAPVEIGFADADLRALVESWSAPPAVETPVEPAPATVQTARVSRDPAMPPTPATVARQPERLALAPPVPVHVAREAPRSAPVLAAVPSPRRRPDDLAPRTTAPAQVRSAVREVAPRATVPAQGRGREAAPSPSGSEQTRLDRTYGETVRAEIARRRSYPAAAQARGQTGRVTLRVTVSAEGALLGSGVLISSGEALLDRASLDAVTRVGRFPAAPTGLRQPRFTYDVQLVYALR